MRIKLSADLCYLAGLMHNGRERELSTVGISTNIGAMEERFVKLLLDMGVESGKVMYEENEKMRHIYAYNSRLARQCREIRKDETKIFHTVSGYTPDYIAGIFDSSGHAVKGSIYINGLSTADELMLQNLDLHIRHGKIMEQARLVAMIRGRSVLVGQLGL